MNEEVHLSHDSKFPTAKIKKMIQNNQEIGKISNSIPHLIEYALEVFLTDVLKGINEIACEEDYGKITPILLKKTMEKSNKYAFLMPVIDEVEDLEPPKRRKNQSEKAEAEPKPRKKRKAVKQKAKEEERAQWSDKQQQEI